ncbi:hypothetical protein [uncultured Methanobrevibacter sp.]|uniref:hypothetical protein n=1 Tax=uncultured Methanobrevibacter sp. TaxID=253161 RepID=UPI00262BF0F4
MRDFIDFSKMERISPRADSWDRVCARITLAEKAKVIRLRLFSAIPLAASFALVGFSILLSSMDSVETSPLSIRQVAYTDLTSWYGELGEGESDELETLDNSQTLTYLLKEEQQ